MALTQARIEKIATKLYHIIGPTGWQCGWLEPSHRKLYPYRLNIIGQEPQDFKRFSDAKSKALAFAANY